MITGERSWALEDLYWKLSWDFLARPSRGDGKEKGERISEEGLRWDLSLWSAGWLRGPPPPRTLPAPQGCLLQEWRYSRLFSAIGDGVLNVLEESAKSPPVQFLAFSFPGAPEKVHLAKEVVQSRESLLNNEAHRDMGRSSSQEADWESMSSAKFIQRSNQ